jgi:hypothetical protein
MILTTENSSCSLALFFLHVRPFFLLVHAYEEQKATIGKIPSQKHKKYIFYFS